MKNLMLFFVVGFAVLAVACQKDGIKRYPDEMDKQQLALEGKAPPAIVATEWVNSEPLTWSELKGKVVLVDLWAYW